MKLERGDYVIKLQIRHEKKDLLEKLTDIPMLLNRKLSNSLSLDVYSSYANAITQGKKMVSAAGTKGTSVPIYISPFLSDKFVQTVVLQLFFLLHISLFYRSKISSLQGQYLTGMITYAKDEFGKKVDVYPFKFIPHDPAKKFNNKTDKEKTKMEEYNEALRDLKTSTLSKLGNCFEFTNIVLAIQFVFLQMCWNKQTLYMTN